MQCNRHRFQQGGLGERKIVRQLICDSRGEYNVFGKGAGAAVVTARDAQNLPVVAQVGFTASAEGTLTAVNRGIEGDAIAFSEALDASTNTRDDTCRFVSHDNGRNPSARGSVVTVH